MPRAKSRPKPAIADASPDALRSRLREWISADGRTQLEIAQAAGLSPPHLNDVLSGKRASPSYETVGKILRALGKSWADLS